MKESGDNEDLDDFLGVDSDIFGDGAELFDSDEDEEVQREKLQSYREKLKKKQKKKEVVKKPDKKQGPDLMKLLSEKLKANLEGKVKELQEEK